MLRRLALLVSITPQLVNVVNLGSELRVSDVKTQRELTLQESSFVLMLENDPQDTFARGQLKLLRDGKTYPVQSNRALFELLRDFMERSAGSE